MDNPTSAAARPRELLSLSEAAAYLKRKPCTIYRWRHERRNEIPHVSIGGRIFYRREDLERIAETGI